MRRGGSRLAPKGPRLPEPRIDEGITGGELDRSIRGQLRTLSKENAEGVAQHLVMVGLRLAEENYDAALAHAETAVRRAGRVPAAREALGLVRYRMGDYAKALSEFRAVRRLSGSQHVLPMMVDCERGLGRDDRALEMASSEDGRALKGADALELAIVVSGIRRDQGQSRAAALALQSLVRRAGARIDPRLAYAYAEALLADGDSAGAREWFARAITADPDAATDAAERLEQIDGVVVVDLLDEDGDAPEGSSSAPPPAVPSTDADDTRA
ncbi:MAG: tetratricopeptide repeat protein [Nostocoides sp.]